jgi:UDP-N-acetylglucosamine 2-epimerase (non-hydrolysing)
MKILVAFGTRPEAIKLAPLIAKLREQVGEDVSVCLTGQHREMVSGLLEFFGLAADDHLDIMRPNQTLNGISARALTGMDEVMARRNPDWTIVQGDTTTALACALAAANRGGRVVHVEAGLRSHDRAHPFPEELNRVLISAMADLHFCPTDRARVNLLKEGVAAERVEVVGNTVIDALQVALRRLSDPVVAGNVSKSLPALDRSKQLVLVTGHRRESFGEPFHEICEAIREVAQTQPVEIIYPVHLNPNVRGPVFDILSRVPNVHLIDPVSYPTLVWLMRESKFILTDSGGIQEEAAALGRPVLVMREVTERQESIDAGVSKLVGTRRSDIVGWSQRLVQEPALYQAMARPIDVYGDGHASERIAQRLLAGHSTVKQ